MWSKGKQKTLRTFSEIRPSRTILTARAQGVPTSFLQLSIMYRTICVSEYSRHGAGASWSRWLSVFDHCAVESLLATVAVFDAERVTKENLMIGSELVNRAHFRFRHLLDLAHRARIAS